MGKIMLVDGHSILNRAFYGLPLLSNAEGTHTNAVMGFLNIIFKLMDEEKPDGMVVAFDVSAPTFRHEMYKEYKGTRHAMPEELKEQVPVMKQVLTAMNIAVVEHAGYEADDIIGTLSCLFQALGEEVSIISGDRDLLQLATDAVKVRIPKTRATGTEIEDYFAKDVEARYGVTPAEFIDMKALMGDSSDNIPGVPGIGEKTASKIISEYHTIENAHDHVDEIKPKKASENLKNYYEQAQFSKVLATIKTDCELDFDPRDAVISDIMNSRSYELLKKLELNNILKRFDAAPAAEKEYIRAQGPVDATCLEKLCSEISGYDAAGIYTFDENGFAGMALYIEGKAPVYAVEGENGMDREAISGFAGKVISAAGCSCFMDLKNALHYFNGDVYDGNRAEVITSTDNEHLFDCSVAAYLLNPIKNAYSYDTVAMDFLGETVPSRSEWLGKDGLDKAYRDPDKHDKLENFLACSASVPVSARTVLTDRLSGTGMLGLFKNVEMPLVFVLYDMERFGIRANGDELEAYGRQLSGRIGELETGIYDLAGEKFNINSPKQLGVILFEKMNMPYGKKTKTGYSTSADVLEKLRGYDPIVGMILEYRQLTKLKSTYADGLAAFIDPADGRIRSRFHQTITATGRISSTDPNLQNIPVRVELGRLIRKVFVPEKGKVFVDADYSQIELRVLAAMAGDENLIQAYRDAQDIHTATASLVFHTPIDEVTPLQRRNAKAVNFGIVYGISSFGLSQDLSISRKEASEYIERYFETYPGVKKFLDEAVSSAKENGYSLTLYGRRRPIPELKDSNFMQRQFGERVAMNAPVQGTAADIIKIAMVNVSRRLKSEGLNSKLILQIHDELLIEADEAEKEKVEKLLKEEMENAATLKVPLVADVNSGKNWYELK
ncbi:MAG: DNA polymerase I [Lachnospiraceae bacterium]|nr:DNA polymerase I [Lachnospiraceae bacterium]